MKNGWIRRVILLLVSFGSLLIVNVAQRSVNADRSTLGLTRVTPLENAPPMLAFTTVALGGFRGLIANALWIRANQLQLEDKYFEMVQLSDWITALQPHFVQVWVHQAWNMSYNISVKFNDFEDRWRWVQRGIELLRDRGLVYNPKEPLIYRELAWIFEHKMGDKLDDAQIFYKTRWYDEMNAVLGTGHPDFERLIHPQTEPERGTARILREKYKMDPAFMKKVDEHYGPLEWRMPETQAIYWASKGLDLGQLRETFHLRFEIYQSMRTTFERGRVFTVVGDKIAFGPNFDLAEQANRAYEEMIAGDKERGFSFKTGHKNFLKEMVTLFYVYNRQTQAAYWFEYLKKENPTDRDVPAGLDQFVIKRVAGEMNDKRREQVQADIMGLLEQGFVALAIGEDDNANGLLALAGKIWSEYQKYWAKQLTRVGLPSMEELRQEVLGRLIEPANAQNDAQKQFQLQLRTRLSLPAATNAVPTPR